MITTVTKAAMATGTLSVLIGQAIDVQLSGAQVVGWAVALVGFMLAGLISLVTWFASREFAAIKGTLSQHGESLAGQDKQIAAIKTTVGVIEDWKEERQRDHAERNKEYRQQLEEARRRGGG